tara:strand:- start:1053 stop:2189 length:1137 start_codon:yes stop_codon:yes gene_type:complete
MKKIILYIVTEDWYFLSHRLALALKAKESGYQVNVLCKDTGMSKDIINYGFTCYELKSNKSSISLINLFKEIFNIIKVIKIINPTLVHLISIRPIILGLSASIFCDKIRIINSITGLGSIFLSKKLKVKFLKVLITLFLYFNFKRNFISIIVQNKDDAAFCKNKLKCSKDKVFIIRGSGVNTNFFAYKDEPKSKSIVLTYAGRLIKDKGIETLIDAFEKASKEKMNLKLVIAGKIDSFNPSAISEKYLLKKLEKNKNIHWLGEVSDIKKLWEDTNIAILPSRREGLPKSLLEAASVGRAIIATDVPGCREIAIDKVNAITVPLDNVAELTNAIIYLASNDKIRKKYGLKSREIVEKDMTEDHIVNKTITLYKKLYMHN